MEAPWTRVTLLKPEAPERALEILEQVAAQGFEVRWVDETTVELRPSPDS